MILCGFVCADNVWQRRRARAQARREPPATGVQGAFGRGHRHWGCQGGEGCSPVLPGLLAQIGRPARWHRHSRRRLRHPQVPLGRPSTRRHDDRPRSATTVVPGKKTVPPAGRGARPCGRPSTLDGLVGNVEPATVPGVGSKLRCCASSASETTSWPRTPTIKPPRSTPE